jgi:protein-S-isoprenylcysteine O-methyltransferase Ste14
MSGTLDTTPRRPSKAQRRKAKQAFAQVTAAPTPVAKPSFLDGLERVLVLLFYVWFFHRFGTLFMANPSWSCGILLVSETMSVIFLLTRKPASSIAGSFGAWMVALVGTLTPLLIFPGDGPIGPAELGSALLFIGSMTQLYSKLILGRSFGLVAANRGVKKTGAYGIVRHPIYASYLICHVATFYLNPSLWNLGVYALCWTLQVTRIMIEERHLSADPRYRDYKAEVPYRLIPGVF